MPLGKYSWFLLCSVLLLSHVVFSAPTTEEDASDETSPTTNAPDDDDDEEDWRDNTLIYHILPRSFQDSDGDGNGDLRGIISRLDYLSKIGIDTIRLSPIYPTSNINSGYSILNYTDIDFIYGDLDDFTELVEEIHKRDLKLILDVVPNQSSNDHEWFQSSITETEPFDDYYIWADGKVVDNKVVPPNNWKNAYSDDEGSAWTWHLKKKMWYYHKFHHSEPDLNLRNEDVVKEILEVFDFWLEKGVDGFCICGVSYLFENQDLLDEPSDQDDIDGDGDDDSLTIGLMENAELLQRFREHIDEWAKENNEKPKLLIGEVDELDDEIISYYGNETHPGITPLNLIFISQLNDTSNASEIKNLIEDWMERLPEGAKTNWLLSNQDNSRAASRFDPDSLDGLTMLTLLLPGQTITYYGDEIGMTNNVNVSWEETIDFKGLERDEENYQDYSRDQFRTPMQWDDSVSAGFSSNHTTFLPVNPDFTEINVKKQSHDADSNLQAYMLLTILRENSIFTRGDYELSAVNDDNILILKRSLNNDTCLAIINLGSLKETVNLTALYPDLEEDLQVMVDSSNADVEEDNDKDDDDDIENDLFTLEANAAAVLCDKDDFHESSTENPTTDETDADVEDAVSTTESEGSDENIPEPASDEKEDPEPNSASEKRTVFSICIVCLFLSLVFPIS